MDGNTREGEQENRKWTKEGMRGKVWKEKCWGRSKKIEKSGRRTEHIRANIRGGKRRQAVR